jgi:DICT domain-containing protein
MQVTPYALVSASAPVRPASKRELVALSRGLEHAALRGEPPAVAASLQDARFLTDLTRAVYARLAAAGAPARLHARGLQAWLAPGVEGVALDDDDPLVDEWVVVLPGNDPVVLAATDGGDTEGEDAARSFTYGISRDPQVVASCGRLLGI